MQRGIHTTGARKWSTGTAPLRRPGAVGAGPYAVKTTGQAAHVLSRDQDNARLYDYERGVKAAFDAIVPTLKRVSALQHEERFEVLAQDIARRELGFELPHGILADAWVEQLDMRRLFAWCVFATYQRFCDEFFSADPLAAEDAGEFDAFLQKCGFHP